MPSALLSGHNRNIVGTTVSEAARAALTVGGFLAVDEHVAVFDLLGMVAAAVRARGQTSRNEVHVRDGMRGSDHSVLASMWNGPPRKAAARLGVGQATGRPRGIGEVGADYRSVMMTGQRRSVSMSFPLGLLRQFHAPGEPHLRGRTTAVDIAAEPEVSVWDLAALDILVREAGGTLAGSEGTPGPDRDSAVATNGLLQQLVLTRLKSG